MDRKLSRFLVQLACASIIAGDVWATTASTQPAHGGQAGAGATPNGSKPTVVRLVRPLYVARHPTVEDLVHPSAMASAEIHASRSRSPGRFAFAQKAGMGAAGHSFSGGLTRGQRSEQLRAGYGTTFELHGPDRTGEIQAEALARGRPVGQWTDVPAATAALDAHVLEHRTGDHLIVPLKPGVADVHFVEEGDRGKPVLRRVPATHVSLALENPFDASARGERGGRRRIRHAEPLVLEPPSRGPARSTRLQ